MRSSMTAYGRASKQTPRARWTLEISSVNRKGLDVHLHLPPILQFLDPVFRKWISQTAERGSVTVRLMCDLKETTHITQLLKDAKERWEKVARELGMPASDITLTFLVHQISPNEAALDHKLYEKEAELVWKESAKAWLLMKAREGKALVADIQKRLKIMERELKMIDKEHAAFMNNITIEPEKADITEEIVRLKSHMDQMKLYLKSSEQSVGRTLDFLAQEMGREIGTLMAKAGSSEIAKRAVHVKAEVEKIREQVQNIE